MENQETILSEPSPTAYDDSFRTMLNDCPKLIIPVVNEVFGENYTGNEKIIFGANEHYLSSEDDTEDKRVTDSSFVIVSANGSVKRYHIECEERLDSSILVRMFEYDAQIALDEATINEAELTVNFAHSAVLALRYPNKAPDTMKITIVTPGGKTSYSVPIIKAQKYGLNDIFEKKLLFLLPYYIFSREKELPLCDTDKNKLEQLKTEYQRIRIQLDELQTAGEIDELTKRSICAMINHVLALIAKKYQNVRKGVEPIMRGKIIEYEAKTIWKNGMAFGRNEGRREGRNEGRIEGRSEGRKATALNTLKRYTRRQLPINSQVLDDIAEDNELTVEKVRDIAKANGITLSC